MENVEVKTTIDYNSLLDALKDYDIGLMDNQNYWHLRLNPQTGKCWVSEDTSYTIGCDEFSGKPGATKTIKHRRGYGDYDTENFESPEEQADCAWDDGYYIEQADEIISELENEKAEDEEIEIINR